MVEVASDFYNNLGHCSEVGQDHVGIERASTYIGASHWAGPSLLQKAHVWTEYLGCRVVDRKTQRATARGWVAEERVREHCLQCRYLPGSLHTKPTVLIINLASAWHWGHWGH